jgi:hypothetical protein
MGVFEVSRNLLIESGLIRDRKLKGCGGKQDPCVICNAEAICTKLNLLTGQTDQKYMHHYKKEHKVINIV